MITGDRWEQGKCANPLFPPAMPHILATRRRLGWSKSHYGGLIGSMPSKNPPTLGNTPVAG